MSIPGVDLSGLDWPTVAGDLVGFMIAFMLLTLLKIALQKPLEWFYALLRRPMLFLKVRLIIIIHNIFHHLPTDSHNDPLFSCLSGHCDTLYINLQALELPEETKSPETFDY
jgi:hypothetical protein